MQDEKIFDYGPLTGLIGTWEGNKGKDLAPEPDGTEINEYHETIIFTPACDLDNAEEEKLSAVHYVQKVQRISTQKVIHQETGYWLWKNGTNQVIHSLTIPRGLCVLAGGTVAEKGKKTVFDVEASSEDKEWFISQTDFLQKKAKTKTYVQKLILDGDTLKYSQTMGLDIYGREFDHTDNNILKRK